MKPTILFLCLILTLTSCSSDDNPIQINDPKSLEGSWTMVNIFGGFAGIDDNYEPGEIIWTFDQEDQMLMVDNSVGTDAPITSGLNSGTYDYHIETEEEIDYLFIDGYNSGKYSIDSDTLIIDDNPGADGFRYTFEKFSE
ncbi:MAG TPA: hypothetical protein VK021_04720 [Flavobacteriaceae bacterium]|nr:hypothetical protein [Flavobacteriaceae bacterium]